jgi:hypothetical protein
MLGVIVSGQVAEVVLVTALPLQMSLALAVTTAVMEQTELLGTV